MLWGCSASSEAQRVQPSKYRYHLSLISPVVSDAMLYYDERLMIQFRMEDAGIRFQIQNLSSGTMQIEWGDIQIDVGGTVSTTRSLATLYDTTGILPARRATASYGVVRDLIVPAENSFVEGRQWVLKDLLPTSSENSPEVEDFINSRPGTTITLTLPLRFGTQPSVYRFDFKVDSVQRADWRASQPADWLPPAPLVLGPRATWIDNITAVVLAGGFAGLLYYITSVNKSAAH
jgi:hypothetical protein